MHPQQPFHRLTRKIPRLLLALSLLACLYATSTHAQQSPYADTLARLKAMPPDSQARWVSDRLKTQLTLSDGQYRQVSGIALQLTRQLRPIILSDDSQYSKLSQLRPLLQGTEQQLKAVLTADQYKKYLIFKQSVIDKARAARS
jgi:hypothetical protein